MSAKNKMHGEAKRALASLNLCKNSLTEITSELTRDYPDWWHVINVASSVAAHHKAQADSLTSFVDLLEVRAAELHSEGREAQPTTGTRSSKVVLLRKGGA